MKKIFFMAAVAALALSSCSSTEEVLNAPEQVAENAIAFDVYTARTVSRTPSTDIQALNIENIQAMGFGVFAYETGNTKYDAFISGNTYPNFMYNQKVKFEDSKWIYTPIKYWPNNGEMVSFFAFAPYYKELDGEDNSNGRAQNEVGKDAVFGAKYNGVGIRYNALEDYDLMWGAMKKNTAATGDPVWEFFPYTDLKKPVAGDGGKTTFTFQHALAKVDFTVSYQVDEVDDAGNTNVATPTDAVNKLEDANSKIEVRSIKMLGDTPTQGVLSLYDGSWTVEMAEEGVYSLVKDDLHKTSKTGDACYTLDNTVTTLFGGKSLLMIPYGENIEVEITYDVITGTPGTQNYSCVTNVVRSNHIPTQGYDNNHTTALTLTAGTSTTINIHLGLTSAKFSAAVEDWKTPTNQAVDLPANKN